MSLVCSVVVIMLDVAQIHLAKLESLESGGMLSDELDEHLLRHGLSDQIEIAQEHHSRTLDEACEKILVSKRSPDLFLSTFYHEMKLSEVGAPAQNVVEGLSSGWQHVFFVGENVLDVVITIAFYRLRGVDLKEQF